MFTISFYIFSSFLSLFDFKRFLVPNNILLTMFIMMLIFGLIEQKIYTSSIITMLAVLFFFCALMLINRKLIIGGGDIKYMIVVAMYLDFINFALFLLISGILQTIVLFYMQKYKKRKIAPMLPIMFLSVFITELLVFNKLYPF